MSSIKIILGFGRNLKGWSHGKVNMGASQGPFPKRTMSNNDKRDYKCSTVEQYLSLEIEMTIHK